MTFFGLNSNHSNHWSFVTLINCVGGNVNLLFVSWFILIPFNDSIYFADVFCLTNSLQKHEVVNSGASLRYEWSQFGLSGNPIGHSGFTGFRRFLPSLTKKKELLQQLFSMILFPRFPGRPDSFGSGLQPQIPIPDLPFPDSPDPNWNV